MGFLNSEPAGAAVGDKVTLDRVSIKTGKLGHAALHEHISSGSKWEWTLSRWLEQTGLRTAPLVQSLTVEIYFQRNSAVT